MEIAGDDDHDVPFPELLDFCSRAQTLIAELLLLSDRLPAQFRDRKFEPVLFDLRYLDSPNEFEARIEGNAELEAIEDELRESCSDYMERFFVFVNAAAVYYLELRHHLNDLKEGAYMQCTLDRALESDLGLQLLAESMAIFGCLLLLMEHLMSGFAREKLLVAHLRHQRCFETPNLDTVFSLCRAHLPAASFHPSILPSCTSAMVSVQKAEDLFGRFPFPKLVVDAVISRLRDGDIYRQTRHYPDPQHRTVALSSQAGCLYVMLFYSPEFLHNGFVMREIVDRFFKDCWVVPIFLYFSVDLFMSWDAFKEAKASLSSCLSPTFVRDHSQLHCSQVTNLLSELRLLHANGVLTKDFILDNSLHLLSLLRNCNVTLRWLYLHRISTDKRLRDIVASSGLADHVNEETLFLLLLKSSQIEFEVKRLYAELFQGRQVMWEEKKRRAYECIQNLSELCNGTWASSCKIKDESLKELLGRLSLEIQSLACASIGSVGRIIYRIVAALKDVDQLYQVRTLTIN